MVGEFVIRQVEYHSVLRIPALTQPLHKLSTRLTLSRYTDGTLFKN